MNIDIELILIFFFMGRREEYFNLFYFSNYFIVYRSRGLNEYGFYGGIYLNILFLIGNCVCIWIRYFLFGKGLNGFVGRGLLLIVDFDFLKSFEIF